MGRCTHGESVEQVCEHLSGQRALPPAHEGAQGLSEDGADPIHIHVAREPQLHTHKHQGSDFLSLQVWI